MSLFELTAALLGMISVYLLTKQNSLSWPIGIVMVLMYIVIFYEARLYSDMLLQVFFALMQAYGWYAWSSFQQTKQKTKVAELSPQQLIGYCLLTLFLCLTLGIVMKRYTNADLPFLDAFTTALSMVAQWLMTKKKLENWLLWIIADVIYVLMYCYKSLYPTAVLYLIFLVLAVLGYKSWKQELYNSNK